MIEKARSVPLRKVLKDQFDLLFFQPFKPNLTEHWHVYLGWGLFTTWLVGIGRYWDHPSAHLWQYFGLGSVAYVFLLAALIWLIALPLKPNHWSYRNVLIFVTLTSLPALFYAIPVERFMSLKAAQAANVWFLLIVAVWRVALYFTFLRRVAGLSYAAVTVIGLLPLALIVTALVFLNLEQAAFEIMGGIRNPTPNDTAYGILILITTWSVLASPILLIAYLVIALGRRPNSADKK